MLREDYLQQEFEKDYEKYIGGPLPKSFQNPLNTPSRPPIQCASSQDSLERPQEEPLEGPPEEGPLHTGGPLDEERSSKNLCKSLPRDEHQLPDWRASELLYQKELPWSYFEEIERYKVAPFLPKRPKPPELPKPEVKQTEEGLKLIRKSETLNNLQLGRWCSCWWCSCCCCCRDSLALCVSAVCLGHRGEGILVRL